MTRGRALAHLIRMRDMKRKRLEEFVGSQGGRDFLQTDIAALSFAVDYFDQLEAELREAKALLTEAYPDPDGFPSNRWRKRVEDLGAWPVTA